MGQKVQGSSFSSTARDALELAALQSLVAASTGAGQAPEFDVLQQQALTLRSLLLQRSKPEPEKLRSLLRCSSKQAPELVALQQQASSGACCVATASKLRSLLRCNSKQASSGAYCVAVASKLRSFWSLLRSGNKQAPELALQRKLRSSPKLGACWPSSRLRRSPELGAF